MSFDFYLNKQFTYSFYLYKFVSKIVSLLYIVNNIFCCLVKCLYIHMYMYVVCIYNKRESDVCMYRQG